MGAWRAGEGDNKKLGSQQPQVAQGHSSAAELSSPKSSGSGSHPGLLVRAPGSLPAHSADSDDDSEQTSNLQSSQHADSRAAKPELRSAEAGVIPQPLSEDEDSKHEEPAGSSSGWSSDETATDRAEALGQMAQSMLAALRSSHQGAAGASTAAGALRRQAQSMESRRLGGARLAAVHAPGPEAGQRPTQHGESAGKAAEVHWEPAVQLPSLQAADGGRCKDILSKADPISAGQVELHITGFGCHCSLLAGTLLGMMRDKSMPVVRWQNCSCGAAMTVPLQAACSAECRVASGR